MVRSIYKAIFASFIAFLSLSVAACQAEEAVIKDGEMAGALTNIAGNADNGRKIYYNRKLGNCIACHANKDLADQPFHGEIGPAIDGVADRYNEVQLRAIIIDPKQVFGDQTIMPAFYTKQPGNRVADQFKDKTILTAQMVEDLVAYLSSLKE